MLFPDIFGPDNRQKGDAGDNNVLFATKKSGEKIELHEFCNLAWKFRTHHRAKHLSGCLPSLIARDPERLNTGRLKLSNGDVDMCSANDLRQSIRLIQSETARKTGMYCLSESTRPSRMRALIRQISDFASEWRWSRLARSSVVKDVQAPLVCLWWESC